MRQKKTLSSWLASRFVLVVRDEETFAEKGSYPFTYAKVVLLLGSIFTVMLLGSFLMMKTLLARWFDPHYAYVRTDQKLIELEEQIDSLQLAVANRDLYIHNIQAVLNGNVGDEKADANASEDENASVVEEQAPTEQPVPVTDALASISPTDSIFREQFENIDTEPARNVSSTRALLEQIFFFPPISGVISNRFNISEKHYGIDLVAKANEPIKAVADGTVVMSSWTQDSGYVIGIQHKNELVSFYKHNSTLLKKVGDDVRAGDIIAIIGNSGELTDGPHLHFELWYKGNPVNPANFIVFE
ncbi:M23 family metallopeptidase [Limibacter armeniacum]|uniref:M23 family metallopeptidase n=1 Tax=Limibacter armeniacum TaxID=466084 RepID=UPI002FE5BEDE